MPKPKGGAAVLRDMLETAKKYGPGAMETLGKAAVEGDSDAAKALVKLFADMMKVLGEGETSETLKLIERIRSGKRGPGRPRDAD